MVRRLNWGIMGTGNIAGKFAAGVAADSDRGRLVAVCSRNQATADAFAAKHGLSAAYGSYEAILKDPMVEAIYISMPNSMHHEWSIRALEAGKHVLCEKPIASNEKQAREMFEASRRCKRLLVEAFMYRAHPLIDSLQAQVQSGVIGQLRHIRSNFCFNKPHWQGNCRFSTELAGGGLMDVGCYCINFSRKIAGEEPIAMSAQAHLHQTGVDDWAAGLLRFPSGVIASFTCGMQTLSDNNVFLCGTEGFIWVEFPWIPAPAGVGYTIVNPSRFPPRQPMIVDSGKDIYGLEADRFAQSVLDGAPPWMTEADTLGNMRVLDELRRQVGVPTLE